MKWLEVMAPQLERQHGLCTWNQLLESGVTRNQIRSAVTANALVRVQPTVYALAGAPPSPKRDVMAACLSSGGLASHRSAAALWGVPAPATPRPEILTVTHHRPRLHNAIVHRTDRLDRVDRTTRDGIPTTAIARTVLDLGAVSRPWDVELAMEDAVLRLGSSIRAFRDCLDRHATRGRNGAGVLRAILDYRDPDMAGPEGALNLALHRLFRRHRLPPWHAEHWLRGPDGDRVRLDFAWPERKLGVEGDSRRWHAGRLDVQRNAAKANVLADLGWTIYHYTWIDVRYRPAAVISQLERFLSRHAA